MITREDRFLPVTSICNARDIGGYVTSDNSIVKMHRFIRTANLENISQQDIENIYDYGVRIDIDLRAEVERKTNEDVFVHDSRFKYVSIDLCSKLNLTNIEEEEQLLNDMSELYIWLIDNAKEQLKEMFELFANHLDEGILFHCSAGKDRTGVTAALLLDLAGVSEDDIIQDYSESYENNYPMFKEICEQGNEKEKMAIASNPSSMRVFLDYLKEHYHSTKDYLLHIGLSEKQINDIINSMKG